MPPREVSERLVFMGWTSRLFTFPQWLTGGRNTFSIPALPSTVFFFSPVVIPAKHSPVHPSADLRPRLSWEDSRSVRGPMLLAWRELRSRKDGHSENVEARFAPPQAPMCASQALHHRILAHSYSRAFWIAAAAGIASDLVRRRCSCVKLPGTEWPKESRPSV